MKKLLILVITILLATAGFSNAAQSESQRELIAKFMQAEEAFEAKHFQTVIELLDHINKARGKKSKKVQPMLIRALYEVEDLARANEELNIYFALNPRTDTKIHAEMTSLKVTLDQQQQEREQELYEKIKPNDIPNALAYLKAYPKGKYVSELLGRKYERVEVILQTTVKKEGPKQTSRTETKYDDMGRATSIKETNSDNTWRSREYQYDDIGNRIHYYLKDSNGYWRKETYEFDGDKKISSQEQYSYGKTVSDKYTYTDDGTLFKRESYQKEKDGDWSRTVYTYNAKGLVKEKIRTTNDGRRYTKSFEYEYDEKGTVITKKVYSLEGSGDKWLSISKYDSTAKIISFQYNLISGKRDCGVEITYNRDSNGKMIKMHENDKNGYQEIVTYEYNDDGHLAKEHHLEGNDPGYDVFHERVFKNFDLNEIWQRQQDDSI